MPQLVYLLSEATFYITYCFLNSIFISYQVQIIMCTKD